MKTVGYKLEKFEITGVKPGALEPNGAFEKITDLSFEGKWKVFVFYPKDFTFVCPTEILAYDKLNKDFADRDAVLLIGSTDNEFVKLAWKNAHEGLRNTTSWMFADTKRSDGWDNEPVGLATQLGVFFEPAGAALRATFIVDSQNVIQHVTVNSLAVGRNADETLRVLDALQTGELCQCGRQIGEATLNAA